jgi:hypothetical protein
VRVSRREKELHKNRVFSEDEPDGWIRDDAVVARRDHDHGLRSSNKRFMVLTGECEGTTYNASNVGVVVEDVDVVVGLDSDNRSVTLALRHLCKSVCNLSKRRREIESKT